MEIRKILLRTDGIKYLIIPKASDLKKGDFVMITKIDEKMRKEVEQNARKKGNSRT